MPTVLIVGATRGLGLSLAKIYAAQEGTTVYGTTRSIKAPDGEGFEKVKWLMGVDVAVRDVGERLVKGLSEMSRGDGKEAENSGRIDILIITAGYFATEDFLTGPKWDEEVKMYTTSSISPPFIIHSLSTSPSSPTSPTPFLTHGSKILLISSESGSITLRHAHEGGGNYAHHASKAALNMVGKLLALDLKEKGVVVSIVHPGFMRTEMTRGVGFDQFWDAGGAVTPDEAATTLIEWAAKLDMSKTGQYWAPRGPRDIGTAEVALGKGLSTPLELPW